MENKRLLPEIGVMIIVGIVLIILASGIAYFVAVNVAGDGEGTSAENAEEDEQEVIQYTGVTFPLGEFTTNLADDGGRRIFQVEITLELTNSDVKEELEEREPQIKDRIYTIIRSMDTEKLNDENGMQDLRHQIKDATNEYISQGEVINVYFNRPLIT